MSITPFTFLARSRRTRAGLPACVAAASLAMVSGLRSRSVGTSPRGRAAGGGSADHQRPRLHGRRAGDHCPGRGRGRQQGPARRLGCRAGRAPWTHYPRHRRPRRDGGARVQRRARALHFRRAVARRRGSRGSHHVARGAGRHQPVRGRKAGRCLGEGARLALRAVPWKQPDEGAARRGRAGSPRVDDLLRRPQHLGELEGAGHGRHHEGHAESAERRDRQGSEDGRANGAPEGGRLGSRRSRPAEGDRRRPAGCAQGRGGSRQQVRHHQHPERGRQHRGDGAIRGGPPGRRVERARLPGVLCHGRDHRGRRGSHGRGVEEVGRRPHGEDRRREDVRRRGHREPHRCHARALREGQERGRAQPVGRTS